jgi:prepilin-type processing-associated H-X9-DG protein
MEDPFPGPLNPMHEYSVIGVLALLAALPFLRELFFRKRMRVIDLIVGILALALIGGVIFAGTNWPIKLLLWFAATANVVWLTITQLPGLKEADRLPLVAIPYFAATMLTYLTAQPAHHPSENLACLSNLKNIGLALHNHASNYNDHLPDLTPTTDDGIQRSWRVEVLPYLDRANLYRDYRRDRTWNGAENLPIAQLWQRVYQCPSDPRWKSTDAQRRCFTSFAGVRGPNTAFPNGRGGNLDDISNADGLGNTLLIVESIGQGIVWTEPRDVDLSRHEIGVNLPGKTPGHSRSVLSSHHAESVNVLFADGAARGLSSNIDPKLLKALLHTSDGGPQTPQWGGCCY